MKKKYIEKIVVAVRNRTLLSMIKHALARRWPIRFIKNKGILNLQTRDNLYRKYSKKYRNIIKGGDHTSAATDATFPKIIWWCWLQGYDQAPELAQCCYESLKQNIKGYDIKIVTFENLPDYITLPDYIVKKFNNGIISATHYSDIIRLELLIQYGGIWIDSTVLCTDNEMCTVIENAPLFVYQILLSGGNSSLASNWLISSKPRSPVLKLTKDLLLEYWKHHNMLEHYYLFHSFFSMALREYPEIWKQIPVYNNVSPQMLLRELTSTYSDERYTTLKKFSSFHKLSYKLPYLPKGSTFYEVLIRRRQF